MHTQPQILVDTVEVPAGPAVDSSEEFLQVTEGAGLELLPGGRSVFYGVVAHRFHHSGST